MNVTLKPGGVVPKGVEVVVSKRFCSLLKALLLQLRRTVVCSYEHGAVLVI